NPTYPVRNGWQYLVDELANELRTNFSEPVILVGHSMGGMLSLMVACAHPELIRCVVLVDAPVVAGWRAVLLRLAKLTGMDLKFSPAQFSIKRRNHWADAAAAYQHYAVKPMFAAWAPGVLNDYMESGLKPDATGVTLSFTREIETAVYRSLPDNIGRMVRHGVQVPVGFVGGLESIECRQAGLAATRRLVGEHLQLLPGGHLLTMEHPVPTAQAVRQMIRTLLAD
ncbi:MAG: alpha/beta hydrolase, partial [Herbaspirillum sp.]